MRIIETIDAGWLYASSTDGSTQFADLTFEIPDRPILATTAVSAFSAEYLITSPDRLLRTSGTTAITIITMPSKAYLSTLTRLITACL